MNEYIDRKLLIPIAYVQVKVRICKATWSFYHVGNPVLASSRHFENCARQFERAFNRSVSGTFRRFQNARGSIAANPAFHSTTQLVAAYVAPLRHLITTVVRSARDRQKARWRPSVCEWYLCGGYKYARKKKKRENSVEKRLRTIERSVPIECDTNYLVRDVRQRRHAPQLTCRWTRPPSCACRRDPRTAKLSGAKASVLDSFFSCFRRISGRRSRERCPPEECQIGRGYFGGSAQIGVPRITSEEEPCEKEKKRNDFTPRHGRVLLSWGFPREKVIAVAILPWRMCVAKLCQTGRSPRVFSSSLSRTSSFTSPSTFPSPSSTSRRECRRRSRCAVALPWKIISFGEHLAKSAAIAAATAAGTTSPAVPREDSHLLKRWGKEAPEAAASPEA